MLKTTRSKETSQIAMLQNPSQINGDNLNIERPEDRRHLEKKEGISKGQN
jgi:hypothetical protein